MAMQGDELKALRKAAGLSQAELADAIGMARESIGAMERNQAVIEKRTELAVRYVTQRAERTSDNDDAAAITAQGPWATRSDEEAFEVITRALALGFITLPPR